MSTRNYQDAFACDRIIGKLGEEIARKAFQMNDTAVRKVCGDWHRKTTIKGDKYIGKKRLDPNIKQHYSAAAFDNRTTSIIVYCG
ncbi:hypothetical protein TNCV_4971131 [Trichonephila clavipes]|nr:hypothetical protein TNCV_4971131 [Trichonephila clavipes]